MQDGLHIGLAAWIHQARASTNTVPLYPALASAIDLVDLAAIQDVSDLSKACEFARRVNFLPQRNRYTDSIQTSTMLWDQHKYILTDMEFAAQALTAAEQTEYEAARSVVAEIENGLPVGPSAAKLLYDEYKALYDDLRFSEADAIDIQQAQMDWEVFGYKTVVEQAYQTLSRLASRSSITQVNSERLSLEGSALRYSDDLTFASTYFSPLSALSVDNWVTAKVSFKALDQAVGASEPGSKWKNFLANRQGDVEFRYTVINCLRPWFTDAIYEAEDWRMPDGDPVSDGTGNVGRLPMTVKQVFLVNVIDIRIAPPISTGSTPNNPRPTSTRPTSTRPASTRPTTTRPTSTRPFRPRPGTTRPSSSRPTTTGPSRYSRPSVVDLRRPAPRMTAYSPVHKGITYSSSRLKSSKASLLPATVKLTSTLSKASIVEKVTPAKMQGRIVTAHAYLAGGGVVSTTTPSSPTINNSIYVVGFGGQKLPTAPNPNPNYQWLN